jgi:hypothetical protein
MIGTAGGDSPPPWDLSTGEVRQGGTLCETRRLTQPICEGSFDACGCAKGMLQTERRKRGEKKREEERREASCTVCTT